MATPIAHVDEAELPRFVAVEGPIGVGKTTLARRLSETFRYPTLLEPAAENPFLDRFYREGGKHALPTQLFFLLHRPRKLAIDVPTPDLVVYLQAPPSVLMERVRRRGIASEQHISNDYLEALIDAYTRFFHFYDDAPVLIVNASEIDFVNNDRHYDQLVSYRKS